MKNYFFLLALCLTGLALHAQADINRIAPGAESQLDNLLNKPAMVKPAVATPSPQGKTWFNLETDSHVFTDQVSLKQVVNVLLDIENYNKSFNGKKSKLTASNIKRGTDEVTADYVSIAIVPIIGIQLKTPYRAWAKAVVNTDAKFGVDIKQTPEDSASNTKIKNLYAPRYIEEVTINGKKYTYIRMYTVEDVDISILPGGKNTLEKNAAPVTQEAMELLIAAAKAK
jgi:hypothetical protein